MSRRRGSRRNGRGIAVRIVGASLLLLIGLAVITSFTAANTVPATNAGVSTNPLEPGELPPLSAITFPATTSSYATAGWNAGCGSAICGTAHESGGGTNVSSVSVSILGPSGDYWNGTNFSSATSEQRFTASGTTSWSLAFTALNLATAGGGNGTYVIKSYASDSSGNTQAPPAISTFTFDTTPPTNALALTAGSPAGSSFRAGSTVYYRGTGGGSGGSFKIQNTVADGGSGAASSTTASLGGTSTGWTHTSSTVSTPVGGPYVSNSFAWAEGTTSSPTEVVTGADAAGNVTSTTLAFTDDVSPPVGGALTVNGLAASNGGSTGYSTTGSYTIGTRTDYTDTGSGLASSTLTRTTATLSSSNGIAAGTCGVYGAATAITGAPAQSVTGPACYQYTLTGTDNVGNVASLTTTVLVDTTPPTITGGSITGATGNSYVSGTTVYIDARAGKSGGFTVNATASDTGSGMLDFAFPTLTGFTSGGGTVSSSPFSMTYAWTGAVAATGAQTATATNNAGLTTSASFTVTPDTTGPTGGALTVDGVAATSGGSTGYSTTGSYTIGTRTDYTDGGSGLASSILTRTTATLSSSNGIAAGTCGTFGTPTTITGSPTQTVTGPACYQYTLTGTDNVDNVASLTTTVVVDTTAPSVPVATITAATGNTFISGTTVYIDAQAGKSGGFTVTATSADANSGILDLAFPALSGFTSGGGTVPNSPFSTTYAWTGAVTATGAQTITATNTTGLTATTSFTVTPDTTGPTGGALTVDGVAATSGGSTGTSTTGSYTIGTRTDYTDGGSGLASSTLTRTTATLSSSNGIAAGTCGTFGTPTTLTGSPAQTLTGPACYRYTLAGTDNVGNLASLTTTVLVDTTGPSVPVATITAATGNTFISGSTVYIDAQAGKSGGFTVSATSTDTNSGILSLAFPTLSGFTSGGGTVANLPFSTTYAWTGAVAATGAQTITATNTTGLTATTSFTVTPDTTGPTGGALTVNGLVATSGGSTGTSTTGSYTIGTRTDYTDTGSGLASSTLTRTTATLSSSNGIAAGTCGTFGTPTTITGSPTQTVTGPACYEYTLAGTDNVGNVASLTTTVLVDTTGPSAPTVTISGATGNTFVNGTTVYIDAQAGKSGGFTVNATATDTGSGILDLAFPTLTEFTSGGGTDSSSPYSTTFDWTGAVTATGAQTITATNTTGLTATTTFTVTPDTTGPTGGALTVNGTAASSGGSSSHSFSTTFTLGPRTDYTDTGSGLASSILTIQSESISNGTTCDAPGSGGPYVTPATITGTTQPAITTGFCYLYTLTGTDNVGNTAEITTTVRV